MRTAPLLVLPAAVLVTAVLALSAGRAAVDEPSPPPMVGTAGTSFLTR
ncbi:hypothetical protein [Actinomadura bangladeshensis]|uniref:Uncharacterized protein n=1 Tax=Actinomadura bangladeshensis TaxID=453573 RepID=A0A6L9QZ81_9ACTN|nr:hypothetical protein [Actinomadura bangladeshensis]NEA29883.1 hypothetical protein [Actinomadura bangladeshensis]